MMSSAMAGLGEIPNGFGNCSRKNGWYSIELHTNANPFARPDRDSPLSR